jgi:hypothetical protein
MVSQILRKTPPYEYDACLCYIVWILIEEKNIGKVANNRCIMPTKI